MEPWQLGVVMKRLIGSLFVLVVTVGRPGTLAAQTPQKQVEYVHLDAAGSVRVVTDRSGHEIERHDYLPFGEELCGAAPCGAVGAGLPVRFTGKERDAETALDYFGARYYRDSHGRFTTTDPAYTIKKNLLDPQRWNKYAYSRNNPFRYVDPDGREITYANDQLKTFFTFASARSAAVRAVLAAYEGPKNPDLFIGQASAKELGTDEGQDRSGTFKAAYGAFTTDSPPGSGNYPGALATMTAGQIREGIDTGSLMTSIKLSGGTLLLRSDLTLSVTPMFKTKAEQQTLETALHELGHAKDAVHDPLRFYRLTHDPAQDAKHHDDRELEKSADAFRNMALRDFPR